MSEARVWSVLMDEMSLTDEDGGRLSLLFTAAPVLRGRSREKEMVIKNFKNHKKKTTEENHEVEGGETHGWLTCLMSLKCLIEKHLKSDLKCGNNFSNLSTSSS